MLKLPKIDLPTFTVSNKFLPNGKVVMHPFTVGTEKLLLQLKDSKNQEEILTVIKQVVQSCVVEPANFDVTNVPMFCLELLFIRLREKSNGEIIDLTYKCNVESKERRPDGEITVCDGRIDFQVDLREVDISQQNEGKDVFEISNDIGIQLEYPSLNSALSIQTDDVIELIRTHVKSIYHGDDVWTKSELFADEVSSTETMEFINQIPSSVKNEIVEKFFGSAPKVKHTIKPVCPKCHTVHTIELEGISDFFG